jgi:DNA-binding MarR family transcriptional regulator
MELTSEDRDLATAVSLLHRETAVLYSLVARRFALTSQQVQLMCVLARRPSFGELAARLGCDKTNVTGMVDRLVRRGLLTRETDPNDRRISRVVLTDEGKALRADLRAEFEQAIADRCAELARADRGRLAELIQAAFTP